MRVLLLALALLAVLKIWAHESAYRSATEEALVSAYRGQFDHELWDARYRQPYLILGDGPAGLSCTYDILAGSAEVDRS